MMLIPCPYCGQRAQLEFDFIGDAAVSRPDLDATDKEWVEYLYFHNNPKGWRAERWRHTHGCGEFLRLERHAVTHEIRVCSALLATALAVSTEEPKQGDL